MKKTLFATTALATLAIGGAASAQGVALFGDARLGLGWNINNDGSVNRDEDDDDDFRAVSRVRFGVNMTGETESGITFGATIRADNAQGGQGSLDGQTAGNVFVSGDWGTLTFGDTNAADEQWVGDVPGNYSLTGFGDPNETLYLSNGGNFGTDTGNNFASNPFARPTVRYDFDIMGFGMSLSTNRDLTDIGVGAGYAADFGGGSFSIGVGYYDFKSFTVVGEPGTAEACLDPAVDDLIAVPDGSTCFDEGGLGVIVPVAANDIDVPDGHQWSAGLSGDYENWGFGVVYTQAEAGDGEFGELLVGGSFGWDAFAVGAYYATIMNADGGVDDPDDEVTDLGDLDGDDAYGLTAQYDLGGGASINGGIAQSFGGSIDEAETIADFGIKMAF